MKRSAVESVKALHRALGGGEITVGVIVKGNEFVIVAEDAAGEFEQQRKFSAGTKISDHAIAVDFKKSLAESKRCRNS